MRKSQEQTHIRSALVFEIGIFQFFNWCLRSWPFCNEMMRASRSMSEGELQGKDQQIFHYLEHINLLGSSRGVNNTVRFFFCRYRQRKGNQSYNNSEKMFFFDHLLPFRCYSRSTSFCPSCGAKFVEVSVVGIAYFENKVFHGFEFVQ